MDSVLDSPYYRVTARAIIRDALGRILVMERDDGEYEMPGGGWEHEETFAECMERELFEEIGAKVTSVSEVKFFYKALSKRGPWTLRLASEVTLENYNNLRAYEDGLRAVRFVDQAEFLALPFEQGEKTILECVNEIWQSVEKKA